MPGAIVTVVHIGTNRTRTAITETDGGYSAPSLPPGAYRVRAELTGFRPLVRERGIATGETIRLDLQFALGGSLKLSP